MREPTDREKGDFYILGNMVSLSTNAVSTQYHVAKGTTVDEYFFRVKKAFLEWRSPLDDAPHSLVITTPVASSAAEHVDLVEQLAKRWNLDPDLAIRRPVRLEVWLTHGDTRWVGCTNAENLFDYTSAQSTMFVTSYDSIVEASQAQEEAVRERERARRRANPVKTPVPLPDDIASDIARYLRLEFGQSDRSRSSIKAKDLKFEGEFVIDGVPTQYWRHRDPVGTCGGAGWATVERFDDEYCLGMTDDPPPQGPGA